MKNKLYSIEAIDFVLKNEKITGILTGHIHDNGISPIRSNLFYFTVTHDNEKSNSLAGLFEQMKNRE